ncbi:MAG: hypothetical protein AMXMBFR6_06950 [Betaproteobacteria bacterium]
MASERIDVRLLGREYRLSCEPSEREMLLDAVRLLENRLAELSERTKASGERLAIMAAVNLAHELVQARRLSGVDLQDYQRRIVAMKKRLDQALATQDSLF